MGGTVTSTWWGGDPDLRDLDTGLSKRDVYNIQTSWTIVYRDADTYGIKFFLGLFRMDPVTKTYFKSISKMEEEDIKKSYVFKAHVLNLMASLDTAVHNLHRPQVVEALMNKLGETHKQKKVAVKHFNEIREIILAELKAELNASNHLLQSWARFIDFIYKHIFRELEDKMILNIS